MNVPFPLHRNPRSVLERGLAHAAAGVANVCANCAYTSMHLESASLLILVGYLVREGNRDLAGLAALAAAPLPPMTAYTVERVMHRLAEASEKDVENWDAEAIALHLVRAAYVSYAGLPVHERQDFVTALLAGTASLRMLQAFDLENDLNPKRTAPPEPPAEPEPKP